MRLIVSHHHCLRALRSFQSLLTSCATVTFECKILWHDCHSLVSLFFSHSIQYICELSLLFGWKLRDIWDDLRLGGPNWRHFRGGTIGWISIVWIWLTDFITHTTTTTKRDLLLPFCCFVVTWGQTCWLYMTPFQAHKHIPLVPFLLHRDIVHRNSIMHWIIYARAMRQGYIIMMTQTVTVWTMKAQGPPCLLYCGMRVRAITRFTRVVHKDLSLHHRLEWRVLCAAVWFACGMIWVSSTGLLLLLVVLSMWFYDYCRAISSA